MDILLGVGTLVLVLVIMTLFLRTLHRTVNKDYKHYPVQLVRHFYHKHS